MTPSVSTPAGPLRCGRVRGGRVYGPAPHASRTLRAPAGPAAPVLDPRAPAGPGQREVAGRAVPCPLGGGHRGARVVVGRCSGGRLVLGELGGIAVSDGVVGNTVDPAAVDHPDPGAGQYPHGVGVVMAAGQRVGVDLRRPRAGVAAVVGEAGDRFAEALVAGPAEVHGAVLA